MKQFCLYFDKKYKCVSFIVHYKGLTLREKIDRDNSCLIVGRYLWSYIVVKKGKNFF